jgi:hypothetical protein
MPPRAPLTATLKPKTKLDRSSGWTEKAHAYGPFDFAAVTRQRLRELLLEAGVSYDRLAERMRALGFATWRRETVTQVLREDEDTRDRPRARRVPLEELFGLAIVFGVPVAELILPRDPNHPNRITLEDGSRYPDAPEALELTAERYLSPQVVAQLLVGRRGVIGEGGSAEWDAAERAAHGNRPVARTLWDRRRGRAADPINQFAEQARAQFLRIEAHLPAGELLDPIEFSTFGGGDMLVRRPADGALYSLNPSGGPGALRYIPGAPGTNTLFIEGYEVISTEGARPPEWDGDR